MKDKELNRNANKALLYLYKQTEPKRASDISYEGGVGYDVITLMRYLNHFCDVTFHPQATTNRSMYKLNYETRAEMDLMLEKYKDNPYGYLSRSKNHFSFLNFD